MTAQNPQDRAIVEGLQRGEARAIEQLVERHAGRIYRVVTSLLPDARDAESVTRDVLSRVVRDIDAYTGSPVFASWVYRIALEATRERLTADRGPARAHAARARRSPYRRQRPPAPGAD